MKKHLTLLSFLFLGLAQAQDISIIPKPASVEPQKGVFTLSASTKIILEGSGTEKSAAFFNSYLKKFYGFQLPVVKIKSSEKNAIVLNYDRIDHTVPGAYTMTVDNNKIYIGGDNAEGVFYGIQSLIQLLPLEKKTSLDIPQVKIIDSARFAYRGMHLDCGRHFFDVAFVKKYIDFIAMYKMNTFHWHLTEDQGWRIEIKKYPKLTSVGAYRNGTIIGRYPGKGNDNQKYGGFYTQEQVKEIVKYAADRYITVIPEIEMPGHSSAAIAAYPELSCFPDEPTFKGGTGKQVQQTWGVFEDVFCPSDFTFKFLENVLDEVIQLFPSKYIHIGGDECPKESWKRSAFCQQLIKEKGLKDEHALQSYFIGRIEKYLNSKGRQIIGWDEILEGGLAPNASVMSWRGEQGGIDAAKQKHKVIMTPGGWCYFDHSQTKNEDSVTIGGYLPIEKVYSYEPLPKELNAEEAKYVLGAQANVWTEYMGNTNKIEYMIFPRISALSEVLWSSKERNWDGFEKRLMNEYKRYDWWKVNYSKAFFDLKASILPTENNSGVYYSLESKYKDGKIELLTKQSPPLYPYKGPILVTSSDKFLANLTDNNNDVLSSVIQSFSFNKATGKKIKLTTQPSPTYPGNGGAFGLVNGASAGDKGVNSAEWLGWNGKDMEAVIDLGKMQLIKKVSTNVLIQENSWIYAPASMEVLVSEDGNQFTQVSFLDPITMPVGTGGLSIFIASFTPAETRFVKLVLKNYGKIPSGKPGAGNPAWLFVDEISVD